MQEFPGSIPGADPTTCNILLHRIPVKLLFGIFQFSLVSTFAWHIIFVVYLLFIFNIYKIMSASTGTLIHMKFLQYVNYALYEEVVTIQL